MTPKLAFTCGDPAGVGPEIIAHWLATHRAEATDVAVIGPARWLNTLDTAAEKIPVGLEEFEAKPGEPSGEGALVAWAALERAAEGCKDGRFSATVTGPVSKEWLARIGYPFPGQTEFFAARWGGDPVMAFCGGKLRVVLATWHVPFHHVPRMLGPHLLHRTVAAADELARIFAQTPAVLPPTDFSTARTTVGAVMAPTRIGVCGLNPHAGESGLLGYEERDFIDPTLAQLRAEFPGVSSCQPGDTIFGRALRGEYDVIVALYHDQGLGPLKTVDFDEAVNVTLGLPHVRTSPDHGTAFGIAGKGVASGKSFNNAVDVARRLVATRAAGRDRSWSPTP